MYRYPSVPTTSDTLIINHYYPEQTGYPACTSVQEERYGRGDTNLGTNYGANNLGDNNRTNIRHDSHDIDNSDNSSNVDNSERIKNIENWRDGARTNNSKQVYISKHKHSGDGSGRYRDDRYASNREVSQSNRRADYPRAPQRRITSSSGRGRSDEEDNDSSVGESDESGPRYDNRSNADAEDDEEDDVYHERSVRRDYNVYEDDRRGPRYSQRHEVRDLYHDRAPERQGRYREDRSDGLFNLNVGAGLPLLGSFGLKLGF